MISIWRLLACTAFKRFKCYFQDQSHRRPAFLECIGTCQTSLPVVNCLLWVSTKLCHCSTNSSFVCRVVRVGYSVRTCCITFIKPFTGKNRAMGDSSFLRCSCCFLLILLDPSCMIYCDNARKVSPAEKEMRMMNEEKQKMESLTGRKLGSGNKFERIKKWDSVERKEELKTAFQRRLLELEEKTIQYREAQEEIVVGREVEKQEKDASKSSQIANMKVSESVFPADVNPGGKDSSVQQSEAKEENRGENYEVNYAQKPLNNGTDENVKEPVGETAEGTQVITQAGTAGNLTQGTEQKFQSTGKENAVALTQNGMPKTEWNGAETQTNSTDVKTEIANEVEEQTNSTQSKTEIEMQQTEGNGAKTQTNSMEATAEFGWQKAEGIGAVNETNSTDIQDSWPQGQEVTNSTDTGVQQIENQGSEILTDSKDTQVHNTRESEMKDEAVTNPNSTVAELQEMAITDSKSFENSSESETERRDITKKNAESITDPKENEIEVLQITDAASFSNSTDETETQKTAEILAKSEDADSGKASTPKKTEAKPVEDSLETETKKAGIMADSTDSQTVSTQPLANSRTTGSDTQKTEIAETGFDVQNKPANSRDTEIQSAEDQYGDFIQEFADLPAKLHDTAEKVVDRLRPGIDKLSNKSKIYFNLANEEIAQGFRPLVGKEYAPFMASVVSCVLLGLPLLVVVLLFHQLRHFFPLEKLLLLANIYLANYFVTLTFASFIIGMEPMEFMYRNSVSGYVYLQLLQGLGFILYLFLLCFRVVSSSSSSSKVRGVTHLLVATCIALHYYVTVFHRAMALKPPRTCWKVHAIYALLFVIFCLFSSITRGKKQYLHAPHSNADKKN